MARRRERGLRRSIDAQTLGASIADRAAGSMFFALGVVAAHGLGLTPAVFLVAGVAFLFTVVSYLEALTTLPQAGGSSHVARYAFNELVSFAAGWALILDYVIAIAVSAFFASHYLTSIPGLGWFDGDRWELAIAAALIGVAGVLNIKGATIAESIGDVVSMVLLLTEATMVIAGALLLFDPDVLAGTVRIGTAPTWTELVFALPLAMVAFSGLELAANRSEELNVPAARLAHPFAMSSIAAVAAAVGIATIAVVAMPVTKVHGTYRTLLGVAEDKHGYLEAPLIGVVRHLFDSHSVDVMLTAYIALLAAFVLYLFTNASLGGLSRLAFAMARSRQLPSAFVQIDRESGVPAASIVICCVLAIGVLLVSATLRDSPVFLVQLYAFGLMLSLSIGNLSVLILRFRAPEMARQYRAPWNVRLGSVDVSIANVIGCILTIAIWMMVLVTHDIAREVGSAWMVVGLVGYCFYRITHGMAITRRAEARTVEGIELDVRAYRSLLLCVPPTRSRDRDRNDEELVALAGKLIDMPQHSNVAAFSAYEIPLVHPIDHPLDGVEEATAARLGRIRSYTDRLGLPLATGTIRARSAGRAICMEAVRRSVDVVVMLEAPKRRVGDVLFGRTVQYVLRHAPTDVIVLRLPPPDVSGRSRAV